MRRPQDYTKTLYTLQSIDTIMYLIVGIVVYYYIGDATKSPAIGNLPTTLARVTYGIALPTIVSLLH